MGGPGSGAAIPARKLNLSPSERKRRAGITMASLYPQALRAVKTLVKQTEPATSRWVVEMVDGKPRQLVDNRLSGELVIRVVYETEAEAQDITAALDSGPDIKAPPGGE